MAQSTDLNRMLSLPINRGLGVDIAERLRDAILSGLFGPGERLPEEQLARAMGVSRGPVREALVKLERDGLIVIRRNRGAFVAQLSREDLDEVYSLRVAIDRLAVERCVENADDADIAVSRVICRAMYSDARDWFIVCIPSFSCPACIIE